MSRIIIDPPNPNDTIESSVINEPFEDLRDSDLLYDDNLRTEAINRNHFAADSINTDINDYYSNIGATVTNTSFTNIVNQAVNIPLQDGDVIRIGFNPLITTTTEGASSDSTRATAIFYLRISVVIGGVDTAISPAMGNGIIASGAGNGSTVDNVTTYYERCPVQAIRIARTSETITAIRLQYRLEQNVHSITFGHTNGWWVVAKN